MSEFSGLGERGRIRGEGRPAGSRQGDGRGGEVSPTRRRGQSRVEAPRTRRVRPRRTSAARNAGTGREELGPGPRQAVGSSRRSPRPARAVPGLRVRREGRGRGADANGDGSGCRLSSTCWARPADPGDVLRRGLQAVRPSHEAAQAGHRPDDGTGVVQNAGPRKTSRTSACVTGGARRAKSAAKRGQHVPRPVHRPAAARWRPGAGRGSPVRFPARTDARALGPDVQAQVGTRRTGHRLA